MRAWQVERRKRTRHLIELGGLVVKAGIVDLTGDDRAIDPRRAALDGRQAQKRSRRTGASALGRKGEASVRGGPGDTQGDRSLTRDNDDARIALRPPRMT